VGVRRHNIRKHPNNELGIAGCTRFLGYRVASEQANAAIPTASVVLNGGFDLRGRLDGF